MNPACAAPGGVAIEREAGLGYHVSAMRLRSSALARALLLAAVPALLAACAASSASPSTAGGVPASGLGAASSGVCAAIAALPDADAAERTFTDRAHAALHSLAGDPGLDRADAARVLEAMEQVETDFDASDTDRLPADLGALHASTDEALRALSVEIPACDQ